MANVVIVAIPEQDDYVWKVSSEKIPHMTILSLGEQEPGPDMARVESYLQHAVETMLRKFGMSVERRDVLGPNEADVLLFDKGYCSQELKDFRAALLKSNNILDLYNDVAQYPDWIPHLTLGFPETPAKPDERDYPGVHWVNFDKIALWIDDFDGPEIHLKTNESNSLAYSDLEKTISLDRKVADIVPDSVGHADMKVSTKPWSDYTKADYSLEQWHAACLIHQHNGAPESKSECKLPVRTPNGTVNKNGVQAAAAALAGARGGVTASDTEKSGAKKALVRLYGQLDLEVPDSLTHEHLVDGVRLDQKIDLARDAVQYGKLGMRWGVRRARGSDGRVVGPVKTSDAAQAEAIRKMIGRKGNLSKLSNEDIQKLATRINLENNLSRAAAESSKLTKSHTLVKTGLSLGKTANEAIKFYNSDAGQVLRALAGQDSHTGGRHNKLNQPVKQILNAAGAGSGKGGGKRKKNGP